MDTLPDVHSHWVIQSPSSIAGPVAWCLMRPFYPGALASSELCLAASPVLPRASSLWECIWTNDRSFHSSLLLLFLSIIFYSRWSSVSPFTNLISNLISFLFLLYKNGRINDHKAPTCFDPVSLKMPPTGGAGIC